VLLAQLSDTHLVRDPEALRWGRPPAKTLAAVLAALPAIDAVVVTGDIADDASAEAYRLADRLAAEKAARRFFVPGNHDDREIMRSTLGKVSGCRAVELSPRWSLVLVDSQWVGRDAGRVSDETLGRLTALLAGLESDGVLCLHHPPLSPCAQDDCGLERPDRLLDVVRGSRVRVVLSGHVHQAFETERDGIRFLGAPSALNQLRHGGEPHYHDTGEPPAARVIELADDGRIASRIVTAP
jgi:3',5'-cyclic-AMP phosphodiesterase